MLNINPISYNSNYRMVKTDKKVLPVDGVKKVSNSGNSNDSNSSAFERSLEYEKQKIKKKTKKN